VDENLQPLCEWTSDDRLIIPMKQGVFERFSSDTYTRGGYYSSPTCNSMKHLLPALGKRLVIELEPKHIVRYQEARLAEGAANRTVNIEVGMLRQILRKYGAWDRIRADVTQLAERQDVGRALETEEERILLYECGRSRSRLLLPFVIVALETGARRNTIRTLRWLNIDLVARSLTVGKDKTAAGTGRTVPVNARLLETLKFWAQSFPDRKPEHSVFPQEKCGGSGAEGSFRFAGEAAYETDPTKPVGSIKEAWESAKRRTRRHCPHCDGRLDDKLKPDTRYVCLAYHWETPELPAGLVGVRFHDLRHSAVSRMIAAGVPLPIIAKIVGWSAGTMAKMAARYGHFGIEELRSAVESISRTSELNAGYPLNPPQSETETGSGRAN
jgi:integrase